MTEKEINRRALAHGRMLLRNRNRKWEGSVGSDTSPSCALKCQWDVRLDNTIALRDDNGHLDDVSLAALDLACVMYAQMEQEARR